MGKWGSEVDFLSVSFIADYDGYIDGHTADDLFSYVHTALSSCGMAGLVFSPRNNQKFGYSTSFDILRPSHATDKPTMSGLISYTPQQHLRSHYNHGLLFSLSGAGCSGIDFPTLISMLEPFQPRITRLDLAVDYLDGLVGFDEILALYESGAFQSKDGGRRPRISTICPKVHGKKAGGYTVYIGKRGYSKFFRAYEKAFQLASIGIENTPYSHWFRLEVEARSTDCDIPLHAIRDHDSFLLGMYPRLFSILPVPSHIQAGETTPDITKLHFHHPAAEVTLEHLQYYAKVSYGGLFNVLRNELKIPDSEILDRVTHKDAHKIPKRLVFPTATMEHST